MITSKLTGKAQTTIPQSVMTALHLKAGDAIVYAIEGEKVVLTRLAEEPIENPLPTFSEWSSEADERAYAKL
jgi:antitoxin PrlF